MFGEIKESMLYFKIFLLIFSFSVLASDGYAMSDDEEFYRISSCYRRFASQEDGKEKLRHCFLTLRNKSKILDSRGYFQEGSMQEEHKHIVEEDCVIEKHNALIEEWTAILDVYEKYKDHHYDALNNNCCTVAVEALGAIGITETHLRYCNFGIGTRLKVSSSLKEACSFKTTSASEDKKSS